MKIWKVGGVRNRGEWETFQLISRKKQFFRYLGNKVEELT